LNIEIYSYSFFMALGMFAAFVLSIFIALRMSLRMPAYLICLSGAALSVPVGARILFALTNKSVYAAHPELIFSLNSKGFALYGGLLLATVSTLILCKVLKISVWRFADSITPGVAIGLLISRIGCFLNGCCFGTKTDLPWGVVFPVGSQAGDYQLFHNIDSSGLAGLFLKPQPIHPTQIYEMIGLLSALAFAFAVANLVNKRHSNKRHPCDAKQPENKKVTSCRVDDSDNAEYQIIPINQLDNTGIHTNLANTVDGIIFASFVLAYTAFRWFNHFFRVPSNAASGPEWLTPLIYALAIAVCLIVILFRARIAHQSILKNARSTIEVSTVATPTTTDNHSTQSGIVSKS
jgi:prolipoprotein diacylglyceryl transferase